MKTTLKMILLATCMAGLTISLRAQSMEDDAGTITTDTEVADDATRPGKEEVKEPTGEPKGTNVTGAETTTTEATVDPSDANKDAQSSAGEKGSPSNDAKK
jgi:hypothetical protein